MDTTEASVLLEHGNIQVGRVDVEELLRRTEGWPVALQFAARSLGSGSRGVARAVSLASDDRLVADYLEFELLSRLPPSLVSFLTRSSVLERMSGPLCDAVLARTGSADILESLSRSDLMVVPLDRRRQWYRFHRLLRELLRAHLERREPALAVELTRRAAAWCEDNDLPESAVEYAMAAGDADRAARLVVDAIRPAYAAGGTARLKQWFGWFEANQLIERYPAVAVLGAGLNAIAGRPAAAQVWADAARQATSDGIVSHGGPSIDGPLALLEAALCRRGVEQMAADAELARALAPTGSTGYASAQLLLGISRLLTGDLDQADRSLADAAEIGADVGTGSAVVALAERSLLAMARGEWQQAEALAEGRARCRGSGRRSGCPWPAGVVRPWTGRSVSQLAHDRQRPARGDREGDIVHRHHRGSASSRSEDVGEMLDLQDQLGSAQVNSSITPCAGGASTVERSRRGELVAGASSAAPGATGSQEEHEQRTCDGLATRPRTTPARCDLLTRRESLRPLPRCHGGRMSSAAHHPMGVRCGSTCRRRTSGRSIGRTLPA